MKRKADMMNKRKFRPFQRLVRFVNNAGIRKKMILIYMIAVFIPILTFGTFYLIRTGETVRRQSTEKLLSELRQSSQEMNTMFFSVEEMASMLVFDKALNTRINQQYESLIDARDVYQEIWDQSASMRGNWSYLRNVVIYFDNPGLVTSWPYFINVDDYMQDTVEMQYIEERKAQGYWTGVRDVNASREYWYPTDGEQKGTTERVFAYSRAMNYFGSASIAKGFVCFEIYEEKLYECLAMEKSDNEVFLLDDLGRVLIGSDDSSVLEEYTGLENFLSAKEDYQYITIEDDKRIITYNRLDNGWNMVMGISIEDAMSPQWNMIKTGVFFLLGSMVVSVAAILAFSIPYSKRATRLVTKMEHYMDGSFSLDEPIGGRDEIGRMDEQFTALAQNLNDTIQEQYILKLQQTKSRLDTLQTQVNPHFLYNALSTIGWLVDGGNPGTARSAVDALARFYQINLSRGQDRIPLKQELECLDAWLFVQKLRYPGRIYVYYELDETLESVMIPKLTLQALVENSIQHGMAGEREVISVFVSSSEKHGKAHVIVQDDGLGMSVEQLEALQSGSVESARGNGIGFTNIDQRIKLHCGEEYGLKVSSEEGRGTCVEIILPIQESDEAS